MMILNSFEIKWSDPNIWIFFRTQLFWYFFLIKDDWLYVPSWSRENRTKQEHLPSKVDQFHFPKISSPMGTIYLSRTDMFGIMFRNFMVLLSLRSSISNDNNIMASFVFGDSLLDVGNNNYIVSLAKANHDPYGIDFGRMPTGRFSNGRTVVDIIGEMRVYWVLCQVLSLLLICYLVQLLISSLWTTRAATGSWFYSSLFVSLYCWIEGSKRCQLCLWCRWNSQLHWRDFCKFMLLFSKYWNLVSYSWNALYLPLSWNNYI